MLMFRGLYLYTLLSYSVSSGALESSDLLLSYSMKTLALHNTIILIIITHTSLYLPDQSYPISTIPYTDTGYKGTKTQLQYVPKAGYKEVSDEVFEVNMEALEKLEALDDVDSVDHDMDLSAYGGED